MSERYKLNEARKRLEPTSLLCQYCWKAISEKMEDNYFAPVYREKNRVNAVVFRSVNFNKIHVGIPRCPSCKKNHQNNKIVGWIIGLIVALLIVKLVTVYFAGQISYAIFFGILGFIIPLFFVSKLATTIIVVRSGIFTEREGAEREPQVMALLREGWTLDQPSA